jgi:hypothetical protein
MTNAAVTHGAPTGWGARHPRLLGALLLFALHAALAPFAPPAFGFKPEVGYYLIGIAQIVYLVPALILLMKLERPEMAKGMLFAALATFVVNAGGCALLFYELSKIG